MESINLTEGVKLCIQTAIGMRVRGVKEVEFTGRAVEGKDPSAVEAEKRMGHYSVAVAAITVEAEKRIGHIKERNNATLDE
jgi:hypothetical protein